MKIEVDRYSLINIIRSCQLYDTKHIQKYTDLHIGYFNARAYTWVWFDESYGDWNDLSEQELIDIYEEIRESRLEYIKENKLVLEAQERVKAQYKERIDIVRKIIKLKPDYSIFKEFTELGVGRFVIDWIWVPEDNSIWNRFTDKSLSELYEKVKANQVKLLYKK